MDIRVHSTHMTVAEPLREFAETRIEHAARVFDGVDTIDVEFSEEHNPRRSQERFSVEVTANAAGRTLRVESTAGDERSALDDAADRFERRLRRLKERMISRHRRGREKRLNRGSPGVEEGESHELRIERVKKFEVKPMTPEEAALQMELLGHSFYLFLNAETDRYGVLYRRRGGTLGLIEPR